jgi:hypothetical protein
MVKSVGWLSLNGDFTNKADTWSKLWWTADCTLFRPWKGFSSDILAVFAFLQNT